MPTDTAPHFRPTRTVYTFPDGSELIHLPDDDSYILQRPEADPRYHAEVAIIAGSDVDAMREVMRVVQQEETWELLQSIENFFWQISKEI